MNKILRGWRIGMAVGMVLVLAVVFAAGAFAGGDGPGIDWWVFGGGGGSASGGGVALDGTLGQPVTGVSSGGNTWLGAGYWYAEQHVQLFLPLLWR